MITSGSLPSFKNSFYSADITLKSPSSGFMLSLMETGWDGSTFKSANMVTISGSEGYLFDQSGNFFGGYISGVPFNLDIYYDYTNLSFSYFHNDVLMANALDVTGVSIPDGGTINLIMFDNHANSSASILVSGVKS